MEAIAGYGGDGLKKKKVRPDFVIIDVSVDSKTTYQPQGTHVTARRIRRRSMGKFKVVAGPGSHVSRNVGYGFQWKVDVGQSAVEVLRLDQMCFLYSQFPFLFPSRKRISVALPRLMSIYHDSTGCDGDRLIPTIILSYR